MVIHNVLDNVFNTWSNIAVLRVLNRVRIGLSGREIAKQAKMSAPSCLDALSSLENLNIVIRHRGGREHLFFLNREHYIVQKIIIPSFNAEKKFPTDIYNYIEEKLQKYSTSLIVFGSTARKEEVIDSDFDLCVVYDDSKLKGKIEQIIITESETLFKKYGILLSTFYITEKEFIKRAKSQRPPVKEILKDGLVISGKSIRDLLNE